MKKENEEIKVQLEKYLSERTAINNGSDVSMAQLNIWVAEFMDGYNKRSIDNFEGYSPFDIQQLIDDQWGVDSPIKINTLNDEDFEQIPILRQVMTLTGIIQREGKIKLTPTGAIPVKYLVELYKQGVPCEFMEREVKNKGKIRCEAECRNVVLTHMVVKTMRLVKIQKGIMTLTKAGEKIIANKQDLLERLLKILTSDYYMSYFDGCESDDAAVYANGYSLLLLAKYGSEERSYKFYAEKYYTAFPMFLKEFYSTHVSSLDKWAALCYEIRTFRNYLRHFGLIEYKEIGQLRDNTDDILVKKSVLFDKLFTIIK